MRKKVFHLDTSVSNLNLLPLEKILQEFSHLILPRQKAQIGKVLGLLGIKIQHLNELILLKIDSLLVGERINELILLRKR